MPEQQSRAAGESANDKSDVVGEILEAQPVHGPARTADASRLRTKHKPACFRQARGQRVEVVDAVADRAHDVAAARKHDHVEDALGAEGGGSGLIKATLQNN
jgi:hypothetical protein